MSDKPGARKIKLQFRPAKGHTTHLDDWCHFTQDGQVGEYPYEIGRQKLQDFPLNFIEWKQPTTPKKKAKQFEPKKVKEEPDKSLKESGTETKD